MVKSKDSKGKVILAFVFAALLAACMTPQKATNYLKKKDLLDDTCAANFPARPDTVFKEGELVIETYYMPGDTAYSYDTVYIISPTKVVRQFRVDTLVKTVIDSALLDATQDIANKLQKELNEQKAKVKRRGKLSLYSIIANVLLLVGIVFYLGRKMKN